MALSCIVFKAITSRCISSYVTLEFFECRGTVYGKEWTLLLIIIEWMRMPQAIFLYILAISSSHIIFEMLTLVYERGMDIV